MLCIDSSRVRRQPRPVARESEAELPTQVTRAHSALRVAPARRRTPASTARIAVPSRIGVAIQARTVRQALLDALAPRRAGGAELIRGRLLAAHELPQEGGEQLVGRDADHERDRDQERVERLGPEGPGRDPEDEAHEQGHQDAQEPTLSFTARRSRVTALKAPLMARSAPESAAGRRPTPRAKAIPSKYAVVLWISPSSISKRSSPRSSTRFPVGSKPSYGEPLNVPPMRHSTTAWRSSATTRETVVSRSGAAANSPAKAARSSSRPRSTCIA